MPVPVLFTTNSNSPNSAEAAHLPGIGRVGIGEVIGVRHWRERKYGSLRWCYRRFLLNASHKYCSRYDYYRGYYTYYDFSFHIFSLPFYFTFLRLSNNYLNHIRIAFAHIKSDSSCIQHFDSPTKTKYKNTT